MFHTYSVLAQCTGVQWPRPGHWRSRVNLRKSWLVGTSHTPTILCFVLPNPRRGTVWVFWLLVVTVWSRLWVCRVTSSPSSRRLLPHSEPGVVWGFRLSVRNVRRPFLSEACLFQRRPRLPARPLVGDAAVACVFLDPFCVFPPILREIDGGQRRRNRKGARIETRSYAFHKWKQRNERPTVGGVSNDAVGA